MRESQVRALVVAVLMITSVMVGFPTGVAAEATQGEIDITIDGELEPGNTVTLTGTINGSAVDGAEVFVNGDSVGTTDADGRIDVTVPDAAEMGIAMETASAFGERQEPVEGGGDDGTTDGTEDPSEITIDIEGTVAAGNTVTLTGTINGSAVAGANVSVNGDVVGTTDADGRIDVPVPEAPEMFVSMTTDSAAGQLIRDVEGVDGGDVENGTERPENVTEIDIEAVGELEPGNTVTLVGTVDGAPVAGANVSVNGNPVGATDPEGRIEVTVPDAPGMFVTMHTGSALGEFRERLDGGEFPDNRTDGPDNRTGGPGSGDGELSEIDIDIQGDIQPGNTVTLVGTVDGAPATDVRVVVNGERAGTTDADGRIDVQVPDAKGMVVLMRGETGLGYRIVSLVGNDTEPSEIEIEIGGDDDSEGEEVEDDEFEDDRNGTDSDDEFEDDRNGTDSDDEFEDDRNGTDGDDQFEDDRNGTDGDEDGGMESGGELRPGDTVTLVGTIDGSPAAGVNVSVNGRMAGTTDDDGRIEVTVPEAPGMAVRMFNLTAYGELTAPVEGATGGPGGPGGPGPGLSVTVLNASVSHAGGPEPDTMPTVDASVEGGLLQIPLVVPRSANGTTAEAGSVRDLSTVGATTETEFRIQVTTTRFQPGVLIGAGSGVDWEYTVGSNSTTVTVTTSPIDQQYIFGPDRNPSIGDWPSGEADQATVNWDAATSFAVAKSGSPGRDPLQGGYIVTDAQAFGPPEFTRAGPEGDSQLSVDIAGPHRTVDGEVNEGFYRAKIPDAVLETWDVSDASQLRVAYKGDEQDFTATDVSGGVLIELDVSYSSGTVTIEPPGGDAGNRTANGTESELGDLAPFTETTRPGSVTPRNLGGKIRVESDVAAATSIELVRDSATNYTLEITAPDSATNVTFYLQKQAVSASQNIENLGMYLDGERQDFQVDESAGPGRSPWLAFEVPHFSTRTVTFTNETSGAGSPLSGTAATYDDDTNGRISISELGSAASAYARGDLSIAELGDVASAYANS